MTKSYKTVLVEIKDGIGKVSFNRPEKKNAMSPQLHRDMAAALQDLKYNDEARVVVLTGVGESWSAGMDLKEYFYELRDKPKEWEQVRLIANSWMTDALQNYPKPTIAAVNGWVFGGAFVPLISCDLAIALADAKFGLSEINFGLIPGGTVTRMLIDMLRPRDALYYILTGRSFDGRKATEIGLVNYCVDTLDDLWAEINDLGKELCGKHPVALQLAKELYRNSRRMDYQQAYDYSIAKVAQLTELEKGEWYDQGIVRFKKGEFRPGMGHYDRGKNV